MVDTATPWAVVGVALGVVEHLLVGPGSGPLHPGGQPVDHGRFAGGGHLGKALGQVGQVGHEGPVGLADPKLGGLAQQRRDTVANLGLGNPEVSGLALDGASGQIGSTVASGGCDAVHDHAGRQPGSDLRKEAALCLPRGADAGASTTGTTRRCSRSLGFPGPPRPGSAIRDRLSGFVMGR